MPLQHGHHHASTATAPSLSVAGLSCGAAGRGQFLPASPRLPSSTCSGHGMHGMYCLARAVTVPYTGRAAAHTETSIIRASQGCGCAAGRPQGPAHAAHMALLLRPNSHSIGAPPYPAQTPPPPLAAPVQSPPPQTRRHPPAAACAAHTGRGAPPRAASRLPRCSCRRPRLQGRRRQARRGLACMQTEHGCTQPSGKRPGGRLTADGRHSLRASSWRRVAAGPGGQPGSPSRAFYVLRATP